MREDRIEVAGLVAPATITVDRWGIPHIRAASFMDMFFVQGFNAARDRLWQLDLWRKRGLGLLAADYGPGYLEQDRAARLFLYRGDMAAEWASYSDDAEAICGRFVAGINAYIERCEADPALLPPEFSAMGTRPARWAPEDVVRIRSHALMRNALSEVLRANVLAAADASVDELRQRMEPPHDPLAAAGGARPQALPLDCLDVFKLAAAPVTFDPARLAATPGEAAAWRKVTPLGEVVRDAAFQGSNNWVIAPSRSATGRPILANDPHRAHAVPSLRYIVHLSSPGFDGIGAGEPALPGISIGHNGTASFGLTLFFGPDQEDVYVYETHPDDPRRYRYGDGWEAMREVEETAACAGSGEAALCLKFTRHGPVVAEYPERRLAVAVRTVWSEPGTAPYFRSIAAMRATSFAEFRGLMAGWGVPAVNQVYADTGGDIGWVAAGFSPVRPNWDGLLPVAGDGRFEWQGLLPGAELPSVLNPPEGHFATANEYNMPAAWSGPPIGYEWVDPSRANRIAEVLAAPAPHGLRDSAELQTDVVSLPGRRLCALAAGRAPRDEAAAAALALLAGWDHRLASDSAGGALAEIWWSAHLRPAVLRRAAGDDRIAALLAPGHNGAVLDLLEGETLAPQERAALLSDTLARAFVDCRARMGEDPAQWAWGRVHKALFEHPLGRARPGVAASWNVGPFSFGGSESTPMNGAYRPGDFRLMHGASFRIVVDVGAWDNSLCINTPGQSGDPRSPHYGDLAGLWAEGGYVPLLYGREAIEKEAELRLELIPAPWDPNAA